MAVNTAFKGPAMTTINPVSVKDLSASGIYVHALPGRLRIQAPALEGNVALARSVQEAISTLAGIRRVEAAHLTGRILVEFEPAVISAEVLAGQLFALGCFERHFVPVSTHRDYSFKSTLLTDALIGVATESLVKWAVGAVLAVIL